jgi:AcrR family transcriptional regulator
VRRAAVMEPGAGTAAERPTARETPRARARRRTLDQIRSLAVAQLQAGGPAGISLRAIATDLGLTPTAIYRYVTSREDLLTQLLIDGWSALGQAAEDADRACDRDQPVARFLATGRAVRSWALAHPAEWDLLFGRPVPGYVAHEDTRPPALRLPAVLLGILADARRLGLLTTPPVRPVRGHLAQADALRRRGPTGPTGPTGQIGQTGPASQIGPTGPTGPGDLPATLIALSQAAWSQLIGAVTHEVSGQARFVLDDPEPLFELQLRQIMFLVGIGRHR